MLLVNFKNVKKIFNVYISLEDINLLVVIKLNFQKFESGTKWIMKK